MVRDPRLTAIYEGLAVELEKVGEIDMASMARAGVYSDFESPLVTPKITLNDRLMERGHTDLARRVRDGEFDG